MQDERIDVRTEFRYNEWNAMRHQAGNEMDVPRQTVELGNHDRASQRARLGERCRQLGPAIERVASFTGFNFDELGDDFKPLAFGKPR